MSSVSQKRGGRGSSFPQETAIDLGMTGRRKLCLYIHSYAFQEGRDSKSCLL